MILNVNEIVEKKMRELEENHVIEKAIEQRIESIVTSAVNNAFDYDFSHAVTCEIKKQIGDIAANVKLNSYSELVASTIRNITEAELGKELGDKIQEKLRSLLLVSKQTIKLSDIISLFKKVNYEDEQTYSYNVCETDKEETYGITYKTFKFAPLTDSGMKWEIRFVRYSSDVNFTIASVDYDDEKYYNYRIRSSGISTLKSYDTFECLILKCILNDLPVEIDMSADDIEAELYTSNDD